MYEDASRAGGVINGGSMRYGLVQGVVKENYNKDLPGRIRVEYYIGETGKMLTGWIPVMTPYVAKDAGFYMLPEIGTDVVIGFLNDRLECPVVLGTLWSSEVKRPEKAVDEKNLTKVIRTAGGTEIRISDADKKQMFTLSTPGGLTISLEDEKNILHIRDKDKKNRMTIDAAKGEIELQADKKISLRVGSTEAVLEGSKLTLKSNSVDATANQSLSLKGQSTLLKGSQTQVKADASLTVQAGGVTEVKGSMVKIN